MPAREFSIPTIGEYSPPDDTLFFFALVIRSFLRPWLRIRQEDVTTTAVRKAPAPRSPPGGPRHCDQQHPRDGRSRRSTAGDPPIACGPRPGAIHGGSALRRPRSLPQRARQSGATVRVAVRVDLDGAITADDAGQFTQGSERRLPAERLQPMYFVTREADDWRLAGRAVDTNVRNLTLIPFCRWASALIRLASTANPSPPTSRSWMQRRKTLSNTRRNRSLCRKRPCLFLEKVE